MFSLTPRVFALEISGKPLGGEADLQIQRVSEVCQTYDTAAIDAEKSQLGSEPSKLARQPQRMIESTNNALHDRSDAKLGEVPLFSDEL